MPKFTIVKPTEPSEKEKVYLRIKSHPKPDGMLQCSRCGSRSSLTIKNGVIIKNGRKHGGTIIEKDICANCWKVGIRIQMIKEIKSIK